MTVQAAMVFGEPDDSSTLTLASTGSAGEVIQARDGRAGFIDQLKDPESGAKVTIRHEGVVTVPKTASIVILDGGEVYWDYSANKAHFKPSGDRDFYLGTAVGDAASSDTTLNVDLNRRPVYAIDMARDGFDTTIVLTAGTPALNARGGKVEMTFSATAEAQKVDALSLDGFAVGANAIISGKVNVVDNGDAAAVDLSIGVANASHASSADLITESVFIHIDGASLNINAESDDGTTEVAATDTTVDFAEGTEFEFWLDMRDPADVQIYLDGVLVLSGSTFDVSAAVGPLKLLAHVEKTSDNTTYQVDFRHFRARLGEQ